jgi:predicted DNA-binding transcriptional regulator AlpA
MIQGLNYFKSYFEDDTDKFILIGGTATILSLESIGQSRNRGTNDLDIIFVIELLDRDFIDKFMEYIRLGGYEAKMANGKSQFYRFENPKNDDFPKMIEILSRKPDIFEGINLTNATKLTVLDEISSLSALILDDQYYQFVRDHAVMQDGIQIASIECLVILKIRAYNDLKRKKESGESNIKNEDIKKHKNDVFRLAQNFNHTQRIECTDYMKKDIQLFKSNLANDFVDLKNLGIKGTEGEIINLIFTVFGVTN